MSILYLKHKLLENLSFFTKKYNLNLLNILFFRKKLINKFYYEKLEWLLLINNNLDYELFFLFLRKTFYQDNFYKIIFFHIK